MNGSKFLQKKGTGSEDWFGQISKNCNNVQVQEPIETCVELRGNFKIEMALAPNKQANGLSPAQSLPWCVMILIFLFLFAGELREVTNPAGIPCKCPGATRHDSIPTFFLVTFWVYFLDWKLTSTRPYQCDRKLHQGWNWNRLTCDLDGQDGCTIDYIHQDKNWQINLLQSSAFWGCSKSCKTVVVF